MAAPCPECVKRWWIDRIGATTIGGVDWLAHPGSVGAARPGQKVVILDEDANNAPPGQIGEIYFRKNVGSGSTCR